MNRLEQAIAEAADIEAAEANPSSALPDHVKVSRPNRARSKVLQIRLNADEFEAIEQIAARRNLPVSTVAREQLLELIARDANPSSLELAALTGTLLGLAVRINDVARAS